MNNTPNHGYNKPEKGTTDWHLPLNNNFSMLDAKVAIRDVQENKNDYAPKDGAKFESTDTGAIYVGDGSEWNLLSRTVQTLQSNEFNNTKVVRGIEGLQPALDSAAESATPENRQAVHLIPDKTYNVKSEIVVHRFTNLHTHNACLSAAADVNVLFMEGGSQQFGPLRINTANVAGYSSDALHWNAIRTPASETPIKGERSNIEMSGPIKLKGTRGEGTGFAMIGGNEEGEYITHCYANITVIDGFSVGVEARTGDVVPHGFLNDNKIPNVTVDRCDIAFLHTGGLEAKILVGGHIQGSNIGTAFVNQTNAESFRYSGHVEDMQHYELVVSGPGMKIETKGAVPNLQAKDQNFDMGPGTTVDGFGIEKADAESPVTTNWRPGDKVMFQDTGDGSGTGIYQRTLEFDMVKIADFTPHSGF